MSLSDLASLGSFVSGAAVLISLVFLYFQLRQVSQQVTQTEKNQRAAIRMGRTTRANDLYAQGMNFDVARVITKATRCEDLSEVETDIYASYCTATLTNWEDTYFQYRSGLLDKAVWESEEANVRLSLSRPAFRAMWQNVQILYGQEFRHYVENLAAQVTVFLPLELAPWHKMAVQEQLAQAKPATSTESFLSGLGIDLGKPAESH
jgi:hypothetical protein